MWPRRSRYQLRQHWRFDGRPYGFAPSRYKVYARPRLPNGYGRMLAQTPFRGR